jgi:hypothetical protein
MKSKINLFARPLFLSVCYLAVSQPALAQNIDVQYGVVNTVENSQTSTSSAGTQKGASTGGAIGGLLGATSSKSRSSGEKRRRSFGYGIAGAVVGGAIGSSKDKPVTVYQYSVAMLEGGTFNITTEQGHIDAGDCVAVEQGSTANIRKIAQVFCDVPGENIYSEHIVEAEECSAAKQELVAAQGAEAIDGAIRKVKILCDD